MKAPVLITLLALISVSVSAQKRTIDESGFSELSFAVAGNVYLRQGNDEKVEVDCSDEVFERLEFEKSGDRLTIKRKGKWNWRDSFRNSDLDVYITMKDIERISVSGSGNVSSEEQLDTDDLRLSVSGSGDIELDLKSRDIVMRISGSGDINLSGTSENTEARISGSGKIRAEDMEAKSFEASISGSGSCYVTVTEEVIANISGSGRVYYNGNPDRIISNSSGSGRIKKL